MELEDFKVNNKVICIRNEGFVQNAYGIQGKVIEVSYEYVYVKLDQEVIGLDYNRVPFTADELQIIIKDWDE